MKKRVLLFLLIIGLFKSAKAQSAVSATERQLTDTICNCLSGVDLSKITTRQEAIAAFTECFSKRTDLLMQIASEKKIDPTDEVGMRQIGINIGKELFNQNCAAFTRISVKMAENKAAQNGEQSYMEGKFKRIDIKGFNYIILTDGNNDEKSFIWLKQFPGSEKFMNNISNYTGKKMKVKYQELEVYLPQAKGYYKIKEIVSLEVE